MMWYTVHVSIVVTVELSLHPLHVNICYYQYWIKTVVIGSPPVLCSVYQ